MNSEKPINSVDVANEGYGTANYRRYILSVLLLIYIFNFIDRSLVSVVARPLKAELQIGDTEFGILTGFGFAFLYTIAGIPLARFAERHHRVWIMTCCIILWSAMTVASGWAAEIVIGTFVISGFWVLLLFRILVGIGEAGCTPPANSLIADYFIPRDRGKALGFYAMGVTVGTAVSNLLGGPLTDYFGWRMAFIIVGAPGILIAILLKLTVREPPRGFTDLNAPASPDTPKLSQAIGVLLSKKSYMFMIAGSTTAAFCAYGIASFQSLYLQRTFSLTVGEASVIFNAPSSLAAAAGTLCTGWLASRLAPKDVTAIAWLPAIGLIACVPIYWVAFSTDVKWLCWLGLALGGFLKYGYAAAQYTISQGVVSTRMRATATAVLLFVVNLLGYGLGPLFAGVVSDFFYRAHYTSDIQLAYVDRSICDAAQEGVVLAERIAGKSLDEQSLSQTLMQMGAKIDLDGFQTCSSASASSSEMAMLCITLFYLLSGTLFFMCSRHYAREAMT